MGLSVIIHYRRRGWRWPLEEGELELWTEDNRLLGTVSAAWLTECLRLHVERLSLDEALARELSPGQVDDPTDPLPIRIPARAFQADRPIPRLVGVNIKRLRGRERRSP